MPLPCSLGTNPESRVPNCKNHGAKYKDKILLPGLVSHENRELVILCQIHNITLLVLWQSKIWHSRFGAWTQYLLIENHKNSKLSPTHYANIGNECIGLNNPVEIIANHI